MMNIVSSILSYSVDVRQLKNEVHNVIDRLLASDGNPEAIIMNFP